MFAERIDSLLKVWKEFKLECIVVKRTKCSTQANKQQSTRYCFIIFLQFFVELPSLMNLNLIAETKLVGDLAINYSKDGFVPVTYPISEVYFRCQSMAFY